VDVPSFLCYDLLHRLTIDIWSGHIRLEDHKRLYDYPTIQQYPLEVRQKGDAPTGYTYGR
jgi:hypothetical protein